MISETKIVPRYAETDKMGIIHHSVYAVWYEQARTEFFNNLGLRYDSIENEDGIMTPLVELNCKYILPAYYNDEVTIKTKIITLTPVKYIMEYDIFNKEGKLINVGTTTMAWTDAKTFKIINLKKTRPDIYSRLQPLVEE